MKGVSMPAMKSAKRLLIASVWLGFSVGCSEGDDDDAANAGAGGGGGTESGGTGGDAAGAPATGDSLCERGCEATLAADCPAGPQSQVECVEDCEALGSGACSSEYAALQACAEGETISCNSSGIPVIEACSGEQTAFIDCLT